MSARSRELVAADESTVVSKLFLDAIVVEDGQSDGRLPDPPWADESNRSEISYETNSLLNQFVASETDPGRRGWRFAGWARCKCEMLNPVVDEITDLA